LPGKAKQLTLLFSKNNRFSASCAQRDIAFALVLWNSRKYRYICKPNGKNDVYSTLNHRPKWSPRRWIDEEKGLKMQIGSTLLCWRSNNVEIRWPISSTVISQRWIRVETTLRLYFKSWRRIIIDHEWTLIRRLFAAAKQHRSNVDVRLSTSQFYQISTLKQRHLPGGNVPLKWGNNYFFHIHLSSTKLSSFALIIAFNLHYSISRRASEYISSVLLSEKMYFNVVHRLYKLPSKSCLINYVDSVFQVCMMQHEITCLFRRVYIKELQID
jgi:hypothetical protein